MANDNITISINGDSTNFEKSIKKCEDLISQLKTAGIKACQTIGSASELAANTISEASTSALETVSASVSKLVPEATALPKSMDVISIIKDLSDIIDTFSKAMDAAKKLFKVISDHPFITFATAITGTVVALAYFISKTPDAVKNAGELTDAEKKLCDEARNAAKAADEMKESLEKAAQDNKGEYDYYQGLWQELQGIVDQNGKVKDGYEDRAAFITNELGGYCETEIELVNGVVLKWGELQGTIEETLKIQRGANLLSAYEGKYNEAISKKTKLLQIMPRHLQR